jgi:hypothetical protein
MRDTLYYLCNNISMIYLSRYRKCHDIKYYIIYIILYYLSLYLKEKINEAIDKSIDKSFY